ncbi:MAG: efflux RND transporter periplasmic adaptor subunit [Gammaproteobacteria bacterium]|nr:efflux RND transporter periplasmic adaptor subunit [Gammaproteobacteria bacterium]
MNNQPKLILCLAVALTALILITACDKTTEQAGPPKAKKSKPHLVEVFPATISKQALVSERTGTLRAQREVQIVNEEEGQIIELPYYEGDFVRKGKLLVRLDDSLLKATLTSAIASRNKAEADLQRIKDLRKQNFSSDEELLRVSTELKVAEADELLLQTRLSHTKIAAPFSGTITERLIEPGNVAEKYTHLLTLADLSTLTTETSISELLLNKVALNDKVSVKIDALGDKSFSGRVIRIHPTVDPATRRGVIEIALNPVPKGARPGQFARITINTDQGEYLLIPFRALRSDAEGDFVYVVNEKNQVKRRPVKSGLRLGDNIQIVSGLRVKDKVVVRGFLGLKENKTVKIVSHSAPQNTSAND